MNRINDVRTTQYAANFHDKATARDLFPQLYDTAVSANKRLAAAYILRSVQPTTQRIAVMEIIPTLIGITLGLFSTFQDYIPSLITVDLYDVVMLFGIGLGAGSLKEFVDKDPKTV